MPSLDQNQGPAYWRSLAELADSEEFRLALAAEFPAEADVPADGVSRRRFLQMMGASLALAGMAGCRWPQETILPFARRPEGYVPGVAKQYATCMEMGGVAAALLATSYDGRPIKLEGNPDHPASLGAADIFAQASVLELYDPDRSRAVTQREGGQTVARGWDDFLAFLQPRLAALRARGGEGLAILSEATSSPAVAGLRARVLGAYPRAAWVEYEPLSRDRELDGAAAAFGVPVRVAPRLERARVVVDLDADLLGAHPAAVRNARDFARGRRPDPGPPCRLYAAEPALSLTGAMADHRFPTAARLVPLAAGCLAAELVAQGLALPGEAAALRPHLERFAHHPLRPAWCAAVARDLLRHRGAGVLAAGPRQPAAAHALLHLLNEALGNHGAAIELLPEPQGRGRGHVAGLAELTAALRAGAVDTLLILGGNPVFNAPADLDFGAALARAGAAAHLSLHQDETTRACAWHLPRAHALEAWGDALSWDGTYTVCQPLIEPLYGGRTPAEVLSLLVDEPGLKAHELTQRSFRAWSGAREADLEARWRELLHAGFLPRGAAAGPAGAAPAPRLQAAAAARAVVAGLDADVAPPGPADVELVFARDPKLYDGRFANNAWLQELPDALTKLTWDNALLLGPATAAALGTAQDEIVRVACRGRALELPVHVVPGQAPWSATVWLGQGRRAAGRVGNGAGADAYRLREAASVWSASGVEIVRTGRRHRLACTQEHHAIDAQAAREREHRATHELVREATWDHYRRHPHFAQEPDHHVKDAQLFGTHAYEGHKWGMAIDLNACLGCNACVVACQAENNIPVVGREQVAKGREMHWIRIDRYFAGDAETPRVLHQPVACVHCENAPCEQVCPVAATVHDREGLNVMVYNRCVGTRYCSNNCPFKVRRFNFFNYHRQETPVEKMGRNPAVTIRARGVMEKCTFCVQRIETAKIAAKNERRPLRDGEITPACAQTCPAEAIVFGDLNDPQSRVARLHADDRAYTLLAELQIKPRAAYLARLRNPNPELAEPADEHGGH